MAKRPETRDQLAKVRDLQLEAIRAGLVKGEKNPRWYVNGEGVTDPPLCCHGEECLTSNEATVRIETLGFSLNPLLLEFLPVAADPHATKV